MRHENDDLAQLPVHVSDPFEDRRDRILGPEAAVVADPEERGRNPHPLRFRIVSGARALRELI